MGHTANSNVLVLHNCICANALHAGGPNGQCGALGLSPHTSRFAKANTIGVHAAIQVHIAQGSLLLLLELLQLLQLLLAHDLKLDQLLCAPRKLSDHGSADVHDPELFCTHTPLRAFRHCWQHDHHDKGAPKLLLSYSYKLLLDGERHKS